MKKEEKQTKLEKKKPASIAATADMNTGNTTSTASLAPAVLIFVSKGEQNKNLASVTTSTSATLLSDAELEKIATHTIFSQTNSI